jgi:hypothetical protein
VAVGGSTLAVTAVDDPAAVRSAGAGDRTEFDRVAVAPSGAYVAGVRAVRTGYDRTDEELHVYDTATMERTVVTGLGPESAYTAHTYRVTAALGFVADAVALVRVEACCITFDEEARTYRQVDLCPNHPPPPGPASVRFVGQDGSTRRGHWPDGFRPRRAAFVPDAVYGLAHGRIVRMDAGTLATTVMPGSVYDTADMLAVARSGAVAAAVHPDRRSVTVFRLG